MNLSAVFWFAFLSKRFGSGGPFLESPGNFTGPKSNTDKSNYKE